MSSVNISSPTFQILEMFSVHVVGVVTDMPEYVLESDDIVESVW